MAFEKIKLSNISKFKDHNTIAFYLK